MTNARPHHVLTISDLAAHDVLRVLDLASKVAVPSVMAGKGAALVFEHPSARTRNAAEMAVFQLGGHPITMGASEVGIDERETAEDVARTLAGFHSLIGARVASHEILRRMALAIDAMGCQVPVVNLLSDYEHPTQALADLLTIRQRLGHLEGVRIAYIGDSNNVCRSLAHAAKLCGMDLTVASPVGYGFGDAELGTVSGTVRTVTRPEEAVEGADVLYTDVWVSMGDGDDPGKKRQAFAGYELNERLVARAEPGALIMHCLPAHRGEEIAASVIDGPNSVVWQQAANRLHAMRALFGYLLGADPS